MSRNTLLAFGFVTLMVAAAVTACISLATSAASGAAVLLALGAMGVGLLRTRARMRAESRHRWVLQRRVEHLESELSKLHASETAEDRGVDEKVVPTTGTVDEYSQLALLHDRIHALETSLRSGL